MNMSEMLDETHDHLFRSLAILACCNYIVVHLDKTSEIDKSRVIQDEWLLWESLEV